MEIRVSIENFQQSSLSVKQPKRNAVTFSSKIHYLLFFHLTFKSKPKFIINYLLRIIPQIADVLNTHAQRNKTHLSAFLLNIFTAF